MLEYPEIKTIARQSRYATSAQAAKAYKLTDKQTAMAYHP